MQRVTYAGESFITTDHVADTLLDYVAVMDRHGFGESVRVPTIEASGDFGTVRLLVWAGSELLCREEPSDAADPELDVTELRQRADGRSSYKQSRTPPTPEWTSPSSEIESL